MPPWVPLLLLRPLCHELCGCLAVPAADTSVRAAQVNPLRKVPGLILGGAATLFESFVIMQVWASPCSNCRLSNGTMALITSVHTTFVQYLEDKYGHHGMPLVPADPEARAFVHLLVGAPKPDAVLSLSPPPNTHTHTHTCTHAHMHTHMHPHTGLSGGLSSPFCPREQVRVHDLYIASPNNTQPGFAHT